MEQIQNQHSATIQAKIRRNAAEQNVVLQNLIEWGNGMMKKEERNGKVSDSKPHHPSMVMSEENSQTSADAIDGPELLRDKSSMVMGVPTPQPMGPVVTTPSSATVIPYKPSNLKDKIFSKEDSETNRLRGNELYTKGDFDGAIQCYARSIQFDPTSPAAYSNRGKLKHCMR